MCAVSMVGDGYADKWRPYTQPPQPFLPVPIGPQPGLAFITRAEFDALKREVEEMKVLLLQAKAEDEANGEPDCHMEEKVAILRKVAELVGVDLSEVFG